MNGRKYYCICEDNCKFETMTREQILAAIAQAAESGLVFDTDAAFITKVKESNRGKYITFWIGTVAEYNAIKQEDRAENCLYIRTDDDAPNKLDEAMLSAEKAAESAAASATAAYAASNAADYASQSAASAINAAREAVAAIVTGSVTLETVELYPKTPQVLYANMGAAAGYKKPLVSVCVGNTSFNTDDVEWRAKDPYVNDGEWVQELFVIYNGTGYPTLDFVVNYIKIPT